MRQPEFPPGWDEERVKRVMRHYEEQRAEESVAEDEAAFGNGAPTVIEVPEELIPTIRELIARHGS